MKTYWVLDIKLVDFNTFQPYEGAEAFESEFNLFAESRFNYKFYKIEDLDAAEKRLTGLNLAFKRFYVVEIESDAEIKNHPAFYVIFSSQDEMVALNDGKPELNPRKMKSRNFQQDTGNDIFVVTEKAKVFLEAETSGLAFDFLANLPKPFYQLTTIPELHFPLVYADSTTVKQSLSQKGKYSADGDGRNTLEPAALLEIAAHGLTISRSFKVGDIIYPHVYTIFIASGAFVVALKGQFNLTKESIWITPIAAD